MFAARSASCNLHEYVPPCSAACCRFDARYRALCNDDYTDARRRWSKVRRSQFFSSLHLRHNDSLPSICCGHRGRAGSSTIDEPGGPQSKGSLWVPAPESPGEHAGFRAQALCAPRIVSTLSASADNLATSGGAAHAPPTAARLSAVAPRATAQSFFRRRRAPGAP
jgi:hypothetical protein